jgi:hypothetical protein
VLLSCKVGHALRFANRIKHRERSGEEQDSPSLFAGTNQMFYLPITPVQQVTLNHAFTLHAQNSLPAIQPVGQITLSSSPRFQQQEEMDTELMSIKMMEATVKLASDTVALLDSVSKASSSTESLTSLDTDYSSSASATSSDTEDELEPLDVSGMTTDPFLWDTFLEGEVTPA